MENVGPLMEDSSKKSGVTAQQVVQEVLSATGGRQTGTCLFFNVPASLKKIYRSHHMVGFVCFTEDDQSSLKTTMVDRFQ